MIYATERVLAAESTHIPSVGPVMTTGPLEIEVSFDGSLNALINDHIRNARLLR